MKTIITIIPARGGSKGIPGKNIVPLCKKPLISYSILHSTQTRSIQKTYVSTDDLQIAEISREWGAEIIERPKGISGDTATSESALLHSLDRVREKNQDDPDAVVFLQATSPFRRPEDLQNAIDLFYENEADSLFSSSPVQGFIWRMDARQLNSLNYDYRSRMRRQDFSVDLMENGSIYIFKPWVLRELHNRLGGKIVVYPMGLIESVQIDEPADLELAEWMMQAVERQGWI